MAMFDISTALLGALTVRLTGKIDDDVAHSSGWQIEPGHLGRTTYRDPCFPTLRIEALSWPGPTI